ncbi:general secretion pathway protein D [Novimethylophilus kurashikiensis]|uniref:General secretion pathway protein D n=1 Tax=Novimethylophilus kurashikiensis TaxID=1825523 RepID=A0A2R5FAA1_9PROT|nr:hypothetical protein [Novimethylophilus kurashikiensis]GBG15162.1 general secretion pathway protein D [Novimethylophilus kurashikiensis]
MIRKVPEFVVTCMTLALMSGCVTDQTFSKKSEAAEKVKEANEKFDHITNLMSDADQAIKAGDYSTAKKSYEAILVIEPNNPRAQAGLKLIETNTRHHALISEAKALFDQGSIDNAKLKLRPVLVENPGQAEARALMQAIEAQSTKDQITPKKLKPPRSKTVTLDFRNASLQNVFDVISKTSGINFVLDPYIRQDLQASIFVKDASIEDVIDFLLMMHQLGKKILTENSIMIYPMNRANVYDDLVLRSFYLNHADPKQTMALIKSMMPIKDIIVDDKLNMLTVKATYDQLKDVERLIINEDLPEPEVVLDVEILEVKRSHLSDLGIIYPNQFSITAKSTGTTATSSSGLTWHDLTHVGPGNISVSPTATLNLLHQDGDTNLLANPRIRVKNREKAKIHIGDKIPIETTTISSSSNFASKSANYLDVGLKLDVEPRVMLNNEVSIKVNLEVSNATQTAGSTFPTVNTRNTSTVLMTGDGETQILAGLINDEDRKSANKVPGLANIPLLGRLFTDQSDSRAKTEVVLLITPHVVRNILRPDASNIEFYGGTGVRSTPINFNPMSALQQFIGAPTAAPAAPNPAGGQSAPTPNSAPSTSPAGGSSSSDGPQPLGKPVGVE